MPSLTLEERVARLEGKLGWESSNDQLSIRGFWIGLGVSVAALAALLYGLGAPNHLYQWIFAGLCTALAYHRGWLAWPSAVYQWSLALCNTCMLAIALKLFLGSGTVRPFWWLVLPSVEAEKADQARKWYQLTPQLGMDWEPTSLSTLSFDLTVVQTFLLFVTLAGALFQFQPFASLTAVLLVLASLPALVSFNWDWVLPALILSATALYIQSSMRAEEE